MKRIKKLLGVMMTALLVFALTPAVSIADEIGEESAPEGTITIENPVEEQEYKLYRIMDLESYDTQKNAFSYKANEEWAGFLATQRVVIDEKGYITWNGSMVSDSDEIARFADAAIEFAKANNIEPDAKQTKTADKSAVVFEGLPLGYYLLDSSLGTVCSLGTNAPNVTIREKNPEPTLEKYVKENSTSIWGITNDANIGDTVEFRSVIDAKDGAANYVFHDKMSEGLTFNEDSVKVYRVQGVVGQDTDLGKEIAKESYQVKSGTEQEDKDKCTFEVHFDSFFCDTLGDDDRIVITYSAVLNQNAIVAGDGNPNDAKLSYGEDKTKETNPSRTKTYTWRAQVLKYTNVNDPLAGAEFKLSLDDKGNNSIKLIAESKDDVATYRVATPAELENEQIKKIEVIKTDGTGLFAIEGLDGNCTYYLTETKAPDGYNKLSAPITVYINAEAPEGQPQDLKAKVTYNNGNDVDGNGNIPVENKSGLELPSTGGIGTTIFYVGGGILVIGAIVYLVTRRRAKSSK